MIEITEAEYYESTLNVLALLRYRSLSRLVFYSTSHAEFEGAYTLHNYRVINSINKSRYFRLSQEEIETMIVPRII